MVFFSHLRRQQRTLLRRAIVSEGLPAYKVDPLDRTVPAEFFSLSPDIPMLDGFPAEILKHLQSSPFQVLEQILPFSSVRYFLLLLCL